MHTAAWGCVTQRLAVVTQGKGQHDEVVAACSWTWWEALDSMGVADCSSVMSIVWCGVHTTGVWSWAACDEISAGM